MAELFQSIMHDVLFSVCYDTCCVTWLRWHGCDVTDTCSFDIAQFQPDLSPLWKLDLLWKFLKFAKPSKDIITLVFYWKRIISNRCTLFLSDNLHWQTKTCNSVSWKTTCGQFGIGNYQTGGILTVSNQIHHVFCGKKSNEPKRQSVDQTKSIFKLRDHKTSNRILQSAVSHYVTYL